MHLLTLFGWTVPSGIAIKSYGDTSLLAAFSASIGENLANFPQGPGLEDKFWLYLLTWPASSPPCCSARSAGRGASRATSSKSPRASA